MLTRYHNFILWHNNVFILVNVSSIFSTTISMPFCNVYDILTILFTHLTQIFKRYNINILQWQFPSLQWVSSRWNWTKGLLVQSYWDYSKLVWLSWYVGPKVVCLLNAMITNKSYKLLLDSNIKCYMQTSSAMDLHVSPCHNATNRHGRESLSTATNEE